ncbi:MAG: hypothetical protein M3Z31_07085 [Pseudomonadota bacterium]|nr:hypothetical protein [Pseudomonadota bacterium]
MKRTLAHLALSIFFIAFCVSARAQGTAGTVLTDLWGNAAEPGWGVNVDHQSDVLFLTFFIYRTDGSPYWVTATLTRTTPGNGTTFPISFSGVVNETRGTPYNAPFNAAQGDLRQAGTATFNASNINQATLTYSVDGNVVIKSVQRETLRLISYQGTYTGATLSQTSGCSQSSLNGQAVADPETITIVHSGSSFSLRAQGIAATCVYSGTYSQAGSLGNVAGTFACADGTNGQFTLFAMQWTVFGMSAGLTGRNQFCQFDGTIGGVTGNHFLP